MESVDQDLEFETCSEKINKEADIDLQLSHAITFMKDALSKGGKARFRDFWRMKKVCLDLFKKEIHKTKRVAYWDEYTNLLSEAHALQHIIEEQVEFQSEQISLAIEGLNKEWEKGPVQNPDVPSFMKSLEGGRDLFSDQQILNFYNRLREQALSYRKEILALEIRISQKNKLLAKLTQISDEIFPERKRRFHELTKNFLDMVTKFIEGHFDLSENRIKSDLTPYMLREKIKNFQAALKQLSIANEAYSRIRKGFSQCWEILSLTDQKNKELSQKRKKEAPQEIQEELQEVEKACDVSALAKHAKALMQKVEQKGASREALFLLRKKIGEKSFQIEAEVEKKREEKETQDLMKKEKLESEVNKALEKLNQLRTKASRMKIENVFLKLEEMKHLFDHPALTEKQKVYLEQKSQLIRAVVLSKKCENEDEMACSNLLREMKQTLSDLKSMKLACGLDIELAIELDELITETKSEMQSIEEAMDALLETTL